MPSMMITTVFIYAVVLMSMVTMFATIVEAEMFRTIHASGSTIFWTVMTAKARDKQNLIYAFSFDVRRIASSHCETKLWTYTHAFVNASGFFFSAWFYECDFDAIYDSLDGAQLVDLTAKVKKIAPSLPGYITPFVPSEGIVVRPHYAQIQDSPDTGGNVVLASTTNKQTVMLSGDDTLWSKLVADAASVRAAIEFDFASALSRSGVAVNCTVDSLAPHRADPTKMLPGDGNSGLNVKVTITQDILYETSNHPYDMHAMSAALMSASMTNTSALYNDDHDGQTAPVKVVAAYEDMVYSPLDCESLCIVALTLLVSVVYLMLLVAIVTVIATQCYLIKDFEFADVLHDDWRIFTTL